MKTMKTYIDLDFKLLSDSIQLIIVGLSQNTSLNLNMNHSNQVQFRECTLPCFSTESEHQIERIEH